MRTAHHEINLHILQSPHNLMNVNILNINLIVVVYEGYGAGHSYWISGSPARSPPT